MKKKKIKKAPPIENYKLTMEMGKEVFTSEGKTLDEAIKALKLKKVTTKGIFTFEKDGKKSRPTYLFIPQIKQLFGDGMSSVVHRAVLIKRLSLMA